MKKYLIYIGFVVVLALACVATYFFSNKEGYVPSFQIIGDVTEVSTIDNLEQYEKTTFTYKENNFKGVAITNLLGNMKDENSLLYFVGSDGLVSEVDATTVQESYILFSSDNGWELINLGHPVSSNIKHLKEIIVVSQGDVSANSFTIFNQSENLFSQTIGEMLVNNYTQNKRFEGESKYNDNYVTVYTSHKILDLNSLLPKENTETEIVVFMANGAIEFADTKGYIDIDNNQINYLSYDKSYEFLDVVGIYIGKSLAFLGDVYYDLEYYLQNNEKVMTIFIDGFNYNTFQTAKTNGIIPNISGGEVVPSFSVYTSVTNAGYASMITGTTPDINGIHTRDDRAMQVDSIFKIAKDLGIDTAYLEANIKILDTELDPTLHLNGDMEILETTKEKVNAGSEFVFVHLHELDDLGHTYGPDHQNLYDYLAEIDVALGEIINNFDGKVIITTDHGMHQNGDAGDHGDMRYEDMIIPVIYVK